MTDDKVSHMDHTLEQLRKLRDECVSVATEIGNVAEGIVAPNLYAKPLLMQLQKRLIAAVKEGDS